MIKFPCVNVNFVAVQAELDSLVLSKLQMLIKQPIEVTCSVLYSRKYVNKFRQSTFEIKWFLD